MVNDEIAAITQRLCEKIKPEKIYLFGSYARGDFNKDSDYDFYIVIDDSQKDVNAVSADAYLSLRGMKRRPCDILVDTSSTFEARKNSFSTIEKTVSEEGVLLYEK